MATVSNDPAPEVQFLYLFVDQFRMCAPLLCQIVVRFERFHANALFKVGPLTHRIPKASPKIQDRFAIRHLWLQAVTVV